MSGASEPAGSALRVEGIGKRYGTRQVLDQVSFSVPKGSIFGLLGPNGAGKTTLFSIIAGFVRPDTGTVTALGHDNRTLQPLFGRIGILPQDALFQADLPIIEQLASFLELCGRDRAQAAAEVRRSLARVGLADYLGSRATALSHGMNKRLGLAQAFLGDPELILLDEPTAGLDPANAKTIRDLITDFRDRRATIVISSHDLAEMQALCDHICILRQGRVVSVRAVDAIALPAHRFLLLPSRALSGTELAACAALPGMRAISPAGATGYEVVVDAGPDDIHGDRPVAELLGRLLGWGVVPHRLDPGNRLEQHFLDVTGGPGGTAPSAQT